MAPLWISNPVQLKKGSFSFISQGNRIARFIPQGGAKSGNFFLRYYWPQNPNGNKWDNIQFQAPDRVGFTIEKGPENKWDVVSSQYCVLSNILWNLNLWDPTKKGQWALHGYSIATFVASWLKLLRMFLNEFKWPHLFFLDT